MTIKPPSPHATHVWSHPAEPEPEVTTLISVTRLYFEHGSRYRAAMSDTQRTRYERRHESEIDLVEIFNGR